MWRSVKVDGNLSHTANLRWSKDNVMAQVIRFKAQDGNAIRSEPLQQPRASALTHSPRHCAEVPLKLR